MLLSSNNTSLTSRLATTLEDKVPFGSFVCFYGSGIKSTCNASSHQSDGRLLDDPVPTTNLLYMYRDIIFTDLREIQKFLPIDTVS